MEPLESRLKAQARARGFALAGIAPATDADAFPHFSDWLDRGFAGEMNYLRRHRTERRHPRSILESVRSVLIVGLEYFERGARDVEWGTENRSSTPRSGLRDPRSMGRVAAYAAGPEYHQFIWDRLNDLAAWLQAEVPGSAAAAVTDTAPLLERDFARRAGLGWIGKNTMLINPRRGSFFFLGALLTDLELLPDEPFAGSHCGTCTACLDACPTNAFPEPHVLDATRCISYLTIEQRSSIAAELREPIGDWLFGCDVCQDVCPWNRKTAGEPVAFPHDPALERLDPIELLSLDEAAFRQRFKQTSLWRTRRTGLLRNAAIVLGNVGDEQALPALERALGDEEVIAEAAAWAIERIRQRCSRVNSGSPDSSSLRTSRNALPRT